MLSKKRVFASDVIFPLRFSTIAREQKKDKKFKKLMQNKSKNKNFRQFLFNNISIWTIKNQI